MTLEEAGAGTGTAPTHTGPDCPGGSRLCSRRRSSPARHNAQSSPRPGTAAPARTRTGDCCRRILTQVPNPKVVLLPLSSLLCVDLNRQHFFFFCHSEPLHCPHTSLKGFFKTFTLCICLTRIVSIQKIHIRGYFFRYRIQTHCLMQSLFDIFVGHCL